MKCAYLFEILGNKLTIKLQNLVIAVIWFAMQLYTKVTVLLPQCHII